MRPGYFEVGRSQLRPGELIFVSTHYEDDPHFHFEEPVRINKGEGLKFVCNYVNESDQFIRFGPTAGCSCDHLLGRSRCSSCGPLPGIHQS